MTRAPRLPAKPVGAISAQKYSERDLEWKLIKQVEAMGGVCMKWVSPGRSGVPDRIIIMPGGKIAFVEMKRPGETPKPLQARQLKQLQELGCQATFLRSQEDIDAFLK